MATKKTKKAKPKKPEIAEKNIKTGYNAGTVSKVQKPEGRTFSIIGILCAVLSLIGLPIVFGPLGVIFGYLGYSKNDRDYGKLAIILSIVLAVISASIGAIIYSAAY